MVYCFSVVLKQYGFDSQKAHGFCDRESTMFSTAYKHWGRKEVTLDTWNIPRERTMFPLTPACKLMKKKKISSLIQSELHLIVSESTTTRLLLWEWNEIFSFSFRIRASPLLMRGEFSRALACLPTRWRLNDNDSLDKPYAEFCNHNMQ